MWSKLMKYYLKKIDTSFHQCLPNMVQRLFADVITWRDLVYEYSWAKSPMISGYVVSCYYQLIDSIDETRFLQTRILLLSTDR